MSSDLIPCKSTTTLENAKFAIDCNGNVTVRVSDDCSLEVLESILAALGGSVAATKNIYNETIVSADTEQSLVLPTSISGYSIRTRGGGTLKISHVSGESGSMFLTVPGRATHTDSRSYSNLTLYFQSPSVGEIVEIVAWS